MTDKLRPTASDAILEAAFDLFAENPGASLNEIAKRAGVGRATLHRYFSGREDLILALTQAAIQEMDQAAEQACENVQSAGEALKRILDAMIPLGDRYRFMANEPLEDHPEIAGEFDRQQRETKDLIEEAKQEGVFDSSVPTEWIVQAYDYLLYAAWDSVNAHQSTPTQASNLAWRTLVGGLGRQAR